MHFLTVFYIMLLFSHTVALSAAHRKANLKIVIRAEAEWITDLELSFLCAIFCTFLKLKIRRENSYVYLYGLRKNF